MKTAISLFLLLMTSNLFAQETPYGVKFTAYSTDTTIQKCDVRYSDTKLYFLNSKEMSRFLHVDPMAELYPSFSPYHMAMNNPIMFVDPTGMWSASYDSASNTVHATAEEGDTFEDLYKQTNMNKEEFEKWAAANGYDLSQGANEFSFNITALVYAANSSVDPNNSNSNCHGFLLAAKGLTNSESQAGQVSTKNFSQVSSPLMGDMASFNMAGSFQRNGGPIIDGTNIQGHSAIYLLQNQAGENQYLNRINTGQPISVSTQSEIVSFFSNPSNIYPSANAYSIMPKLNSVPVFMRKK